MMIIEKETIKPLQDVGLVITIHFTLEHGSYPGGYMISKPASAGGNYLPDYKCYGSNHVLYNSPSCYLHEKDGKFIVTVHETLGVLIVGFGDFVKEFDDLDSAIQEILNYYFGDPTPMLKQNRFLLEAWNEAKQQEPNKEPDLEQLNTQIKIRLEKEFPPSIPREVKPEELYIKEVYQDKYCWKATISLVENDQIVFYTGGKDREETITRAKKAIMEEKWVIR